ncbi:MAG: hydroxymethylcytosylglucuronate/cytosylglucuronate synthase [Pseudonocardiaceae bacterium]
MVSIVVSGVDFGWGSAGKLAAVLRACRTRLPHQRFVAFGTELGRPVLAGAPIDVYEPWPRGAGALEALLRKHDVTAGLVVMDPGAASALEAAGCPTVFVDSLPYLWTEADPLPYDASVYCAQLCPELPLPCWQPLRRIAHLHWVEAVIASGAQVHTRDQRLAVVNFGGICSPIMPYGNPRYLELVLIPALQALHATGFETVYVCGNIQETELVAEAGALPLELRAGPLAHDDFIALMGRAALLITSPGLTTLLEAGQQGTPTVCLPPQNLSQVFNGDRFAAALDPGCRIEWPPEVLDRTAVERARQAGEVAGIAVIESAMRRLRAEPVQPWLAGRLRDAIRRVANVTGWDRMSTATGRHGAKQVSDLLAELLAARTAT